MNKFESSSPSTHQPSHETTSSKLELTLRGRRLLLGSGALAGAGLLIAAGAAAHEQGSNARAGSVSDAEINASITSVTLEDGANLRSDPYVREGDFTNQLHELDTGDSESITVKTESGAYTKVSEGDTWIGLKASDLDMLDVDVEDDADGIVWVSQQRSDFEETDSPQ